MKFKFIKFRKLLLKVRIFKILLKGKKVKEIVIKGKKKLENDYFHTAKTCGILVLP